MSQQNDIQASSNLSIFSITFAGLSALLIGLGFCRFAYTPLIPTMIDQHWVTTSGAAYLGTINFAGYLLAAFLGQYISRYVKITTVIKASFISGAISLILAGVQWNFAWLAVWRFVAGAAGAFLMVLTPSVILKNIPPYSRGRMGGIMFTGVGFGIIISGFVLPYLAKISLPLAWIGCGLIALVISIVSWPVFSLEDSSNDKIEKHEFDLIDPVSRKILWILLVVYILYGIGVVPHTLFLVDYVHTELGLSEVVSGLFWVLFGIGSIVGPFIIGSLSDKIGTYKSLVFTFIMGCVSFFIIIHNKIIILYVLSAIIMGMALGTIATLASSRILELVGHRIHPTFWGRTTTVFALSQTVGAYWMSYLLHQGYGYPICFLIGAISFISGLLGVISEKYIIKK